jgi:trk system potassium uptake protein TrkA
MHKPHGNMRIEEGDVVAIFAMASQVAEVEALLQVTIDFF